MCSFEIFRVNEINFLGENEKKLNPKDERDGDDDDDDDDEREAKEDEKSADQPEQVSLKRYLQTRFA